MIEIIEIACSLISFFMFGLICVGLNFHADKVKCREAATAINAEWKSSIYLGCLIKQQDGWVSLDAVEKQLNAGKAI